MRSNRAKLREGAYFRVLRLMKEKHEVSQGELAAAAGVSIGGMHYILTALIEKGLIK